MSDITGEYEEGTLKPMRWLDKWNPWALRRKIEVLEGELRHIDTRFQQCCCRGVELQKRIEMLEGELKVKEKECEFAQECAQFNLKEKEKAVGQMRTEIHAAIGLLYEVAKDKTRIGAGKKTSRPMI